MDNRVAADTPPMSGQMSGQLGGAVRRRQGLSGRVITLGIILALLAGLVGGVWLASRYLVPVPVPGPDVTAQPAAPAPGEPLAQTSGGVADGTAQGTLPAGTAGDDPALALADPARLLTAEGLAARVTGLEERLARITLAAESASGNAARAEGLLIAFAARRALDRGMPLGYLEAQLRLRFGDAQPNAVRQIAETARAPVTLDGLQTQLDALTPKLLGDSGEGAGWLTAVRREISELFVVRPAGAGPSRAADRMARAKRLLDAGLVDQAMAEVEGLPGAVAAQDWLNEARRYHEARRALDVIETAAILEPRDRAANDLPR